MTRNQRLRPLQPIFNQTKSLGALGVGNSAAGFAVMTGGIITTNTDTLVEHVFASVGVYSCDLVAPGSLNTDVVITGTGSFNGISTTGPTTVVGATTATVVSGSIVVSYDPSTDWTPT